MPPRTSALGGIFHSDPKRKASKSGPAAAGQKAGIGIFVMKIAAFVEKISFRKICCIFLHHLKKTSMGILKQLAILSTAAAAAAAVVSCDKDDDRPTPDGQLPRRIEVSIAASAVESQRSAASRGPEADECLPTIVVDDPAAEATVPQTRTSIEDDESTVRWTKGDRIALWGYNSGVAAFENETFTLWYPRENPSQGLFTGKVNAMTAGTYDYYAASPQPEAATGTKVSYTIPAVQNGQWNSGLDVMLAATQGAELREEILNDVTLRFRHKVHALKITIPEGKNLLGRPVEKLRIDFGQPVAGRLTWDLANPDAAPEMAETAEAVTLEFAEPVTEGDTFWVYLTPTDLTGGEVRFVATDGEEFSWPLTTADFKECAAGNITPVRLTIGALRPQHRYTVTVDPTRLGEPVTQIDSIIMPANYQFPSLEPRHITRKITANDDGTFSIKAFADQADVLASGTEVGMGVASDNAEGVYGKRCALSDPTADGCTVMSPYLFFEDFDKVRSFHDNDDHGSGSHAQNPDAISLEQYGLPGWTGARTGAQEGDAIRCCCHFEGAGFAFGRYDGRIDSAPMTAIRAEKKVKVSVTYDYDGGTTQAGKDTAPVYAYGYTTKTGAFKGNENIEHQVEGGIVLSKNNGYGSISQTNSYTISDCTSSYRLSWQVSNNKEGRNWTSYFGDYFLYLDNIRVTIVH